MSLTGRPFVILAIVVAIAMMIAAALLAPWASRRSVSGVLRRIGMLVVGQICCLLAFGVVLNAHFIFWNTWGDLFGTALHRAAAPHGHSDALTGSASPTGPPRVRVGKMVVKVNDGFARSNRLRPGYGRLDAISIRGPASGIAARAYIYLPPQYFEAAYKTRRFPVAVAVAGFPGDARTLVSALDLPKAVAKQITQGRMQPMIFVMVASAVQPPRDTECVDVPGGPQVETFFAQDIPNAIKSAYRTVRVPAGWSIMGYSTGGYCALKVSMRHSDRYGVAASLSGDYKAADDITTGDLYAHSRAYKNENDVLWRLKNLPPPPVAMLVTTTRVGDRNYKTTMKFLNLVRPPARASYIELPLGGHSFPTWEKELPATLDWLGRNVSAS